MVCARIRVTGMVQGVGYRYFAKQQANLYALRGYVKNKADGSVELEVEGEKEVVEKFKSLLERGPGFSDVERVEINYEPYLNKYNKFSVEF